MCEVRLWSELTAILSTLTWAINGYLIFLQNFIVNLYQWILLHQIMGLIVPCGKICITVNSINLFFYKRKKNIDMTCINGLWVLSQTDRTDSDSDLKLPLFYPTRTTVLGVTTFEVSITVPPPPVSAWHTLSAVCLSAELTHFEWSHYIFYSSVQKCCPSLIRLVTNTGNPGELSKSKTQKGSHYQFTLSFIKSLQW